MPAIDQGLEAKRFFVIPRTLIFLFDEQDRVLLLKGADDKRLWAGKLNGIGGHLEQGEDILESAHRELQEETGITDADLWLCGQIMIAVTEEQGVAVFVFKGKYADQKFIPSPEGELDWVPMDEIGTKPLVEDLFALLPKAAAHQVSEPLIIGKYAYGQDEKLVISFH